MTSFLRVLFKRGPALSPGKISINKASIAVTTVGLSMAAYYSTVAVRPSQVPEAQDFKPLAHHVKDRHGKTVRFQNPYPSFKPPNLRELALTMMSKYLGLLKWPEPKLEEKIVSVVKPEFLPTRTASSKLRATWLGHACYYVEFPSGLRVLFDPVFEDCCAPYRFLGFMRYTEKPCDIADLPFVDAVVISHSHYDHLSYESVQEVQKHHPNAHFFVGLGLEKWFKEGGLKNVTEMDWRQEAEFTLTPQAAKASRSEVQSASSAESSEPITATISCLPCQHASGRSPWDQNQTLWASWAVSSGSPAKSVWFGGDTGYRSVPKVAKGVDDHGAEFQHLPVSPVFRQIGQRFGRFDLGLIPIGAYAPRHMFSGVHADPFDSVDIFQDIKCEKAMAIHWGTWVMTPEEPLEPPVLLKQALKKKGLPETGVFDICDIGESREF
ncbi:Metallo-hydrolase/oxidoreductase [Hypoxylon trugodes]|uniref:Metallo-hydrolase/oxidoreductase n=1 Tax=Hypoxylon trugodes TaxID=326681 RepID=UPI002190DC52|nr:Metallo-hydrolase/oxidoreductase [Hypoxylon trugodes]KAI1387420.1 Metallo-hydrolase/oxidoreductase [Hypoxylon trugodes]